MDEPLLVAASELKDAIDSVVCWHEALVRYIKDEREYVKDKARMDMLLQNLEIRKPTMVLGELKSIANKITIFVKEEGFR